ncbi:MAG: chromosome segregation protein SMC [Phycisphaerales bacterium]
MRLVKLTLSGFKSFADRTEFTFDEPVIGVVGPNGCGKSNIVDSIKWVLGERSSKSLRGKEMIDVIFAGSAGRSASGMAAVSLTFENPVTEGTGDRGQGAEEDGVEVGDHEPSEAAAPAVETPGMDDEEPSEVVLDRSASRRRSLPIDADTVEVERRLFRDGTSRYLINGKRARLRDIRDLFLDTGIGADAYSIIEQGKVDAMLLASPQERRVIFEEAAGVAKYKQRRVEAQRKLERALTNLALTRQQLDATERRLRLVKGQAAKARKFRELDGDLRALRTAAAFDQYDDVRRRLEGLTSRLAELEGTRREAMEAVAALETEKQEAEVQRHEFFARHKAAHEQRLIAEHAHQSAIQRREMTARALADARAQAETDARRLAELDARLAELARTADTQGDLAAAIAEHLTEADRLVESAARDRSESQGRLADATAALAAKRAAIADIDRDQAGLTASIDADRKRAEALREELARLAARISELDAQRARGEASRDAAHATLVDRRRLAETLDAQVADGERAADALSQDRRALSERVQDLEQRHARLDARRQTLREMIDSRAGLDDAVRELLARRDRGDGFRAVIAPLAELISTDAAHAPAVEAALGHDLQALVVASLADLPRAEERAALTGRVTFLPLAWIGANEAGAPFAGPGEDPRIVPLRTVVRARDSADPDGADPLGAHPGSPLDRLLDRLLGSTFLVEDLDAALLLAASVRGGARFVTRDGSVMEADGRVSAGPAGAADAAGVLQRRTELAQLETDVLDVTGVLARERGSLAAVDTEAAALGARQAELRSRAATEHRGLASDQVRLDHLHAEAERSDRDRAELHDRMEEHGSRLAWLEGDLARRQERAASLARLRDDEAAAAAALDAARVQAQADADARTERLTAAKIDAGRLAEQAANARREHRRLAAEHEHAGAQHRDLAALVGQSVERVVEHERSLAECATRIDQSAADATQFAGLASQLGEAVAQAEHAVRAVAERTGAARTHAQAVDRDWHALEVSRRETEVKRESLEERASEDLRLDLAFEYPDYRAMMADGGVARVDPAAAAKDIDALKTEIARLGSVNLDAIDEEAQLAQRNDELIRQVADVDAAAKKLADLIERLNTASRQRFGEVFATIQEHFAGTDGMFRRLFGGGRAEVRLMPLVKEVETAQGVQKVQTDEIDLLESGIEVIAKPPGKEPRTISQLSGGEKTLTAVALLLAIFQSKPSCFCVLDEVDAALDDANVGRFCEVVRRFTTHSHFIVITHNKKTMQAADRLYGVTMQERGVSTRVSVKFEQVGAVGAVRGHAPSGTAQVLESKPRSIRATTGAAPTESTRAA